MALYRINSRIYQEQNDFIKKYVKKHNSEKHKITEGDILRAAIALFMKHEKSIDPKSISSKL